MHSDEIDREKWDACVRRNGGRLYVYSLYLDTVARQWSALVEGDYHAVLPIPWRRKWGIRYTPQIPFIQQLGWLGRPHRPVTEIMALFSRFITYGDYAFPRKAKDFFPSSGSKRMNYVLHLDQSYDALRQGYSAVLKRNLAHAAASGLMLQSASLEECFTVYRHIYGQRLSGMVGPADYAHFFQLSALLAKNGQAVALKVVNDRNLIMATALLLQDDHRYYNLLPATTAAGRPLCAMHFLLDAFIRNNCGKPMLLDFEGSDISGIARFYQKFGAVEESYISLHINHLPVPFCWLKK